MTTAISAPVQTKWGSLPADYNFQAPKSVGYTLPATWFTSEAVYQLEKRGIFAEQWMYHSAALRYQQVGDAITETIAGFEVKVSMKGPGEFEATLLSDGETEDFKPVSVAVYVLSGSFIFVNVAKEPVPFDEMFEGLSEYMKTFKFDPKDFMLYVQIGCWSFGASFWTADAYLVLSEPIRPKLRDPSLGKLFPTISTSVSQTQANLQKGVYSKGCLTPLRENGVMYRK